MKKNMMNRNILRDNKMHYYTKDGVKIEVGM